MSHPTVTFVTRRKKSDKSMRIEWIGLDPEGCAEGVRITNGFGNGSGSAILSDCIERVYAANGEHERVNG